MVSYNTSLITIFGHKHFRQKFHQKFDIFHEKISTASDFGSYLVNPKLDRVFAISKIVNKAIPEVTRFVLFENVAPME